MRSLQPQLLLWLHCASGIMTQPLSAVPFLQAASCRSRRGQVFNLPSTGSSSRTSPFRRLWSLQRLPNAPLHGRDVSDRQRGTGATMIRGGSGTSLCNTTRQSHGKLTSRDRTGALSQGRTQLLGSLLCPPPLSVCLSRRVHSCSGITCGCPCTKVTGVNLHLPPLGDGCAGRPRT
jgi:hypothetical protein